MITIGIDPGQTGGVSIVSNGQWIDGMRMPIITRGKWKHVDSRALHNFFKTSPVLFGPITFVIESVHSMPSQGVASSFAFGRATGAAEAWAMTYHHPVEWVTPATWKKALGLSSDKQASLDACKLHFGANKLWDVKANDGIAESALIALWWQRHIV
jgi:Holliday junction resolvasome RuvABC endonuclease subunit